MAFESRSPNTLQRVQRRPSTPCEASGKDAGQGSRAQVDDRPSQPSQYATHESPSSEHQTIDLTAESADYDDVEAEEWTQISGPADEEMSNSDASSIVAPVQYQIPREIRRAEHDASSQPSGPYTAPDVHGRYKGFSFLLCKETATQDAAQYVSDGLEIAVTTAKSIRLDKDATQNSQLDLYAYALVIHIWQITCLRKQHGTFPSEDVDESLCLDLAAYFLSAHAILEQRYVVPMVELRSAVQYWEDRLRLEGKGNQWMEHQWAKDIPQDSQEVNVHRNQTADRYLEALERHGKTGLALLIIDEEKKGDKTQLRTMTRESPDGVREACRQLAYMLYSMDDSVLKAIIQGQLPRLAEVASGRVCQVLRDLNEQSSRPDSIQPGTYMNCICDYKGYSPTPTQWKKVCTLMLKYVQADDEYNDLAELVDKQVHPKPDWPKDLAHRGLRRYTEWRSYIENGSFHPDRSHRRWVKYFVDQLKERMKAQPVHAPLSVPVVEIGFSNNPPQRLRQHRHHESSNYLMNLAEAVFEVEYPGTFRLQQNIIYACFRPIQTWLSEIVLTQLAQGYIDGGGGFSHEVAGRSNSVSNQVVPSRRWNMFETGVYANGRFKQEVEARITAREQRVKEEKEAESRLGAGSLQEARERHRSNVDALKDATAKLRDARDRMYP